MRFNCWKVVGLVYNTTISQSKALFQVLNFFFCFYSSFLHAKIHYFALKRRFTGLCSDSFGLECVLMIEKWLVWFITQLYPNQSLYLRFWRCYLASRAILPCQNPLFRSKTAFNWLPKRFVWSWMLFIGWKVVCLD